MTEESGNTDLDALLSTICKAPDSQIDVTITDRIKPLIGKPPEVVAVKLKELLDESAFAALASDFAMMAMDAAWKMAKE